jgi:hypothetical protein
VPWQNIRQYNGKSSATTTTLSAIGTKDPLPPDRLATGLRWIITPKKAVPVQRLDLAAAGAALLFE